jgi:peroxiredoxin Q/BCP
MASRIQEKEQARESRLAREEEEARAARSRALALRLALGALLVVAALAVIFVTSNKGGGGNTSKSSAAGGAGKFKFAVGTPGPGAQAPQIRLQATDGSTFNLAASRGHRVLLYFQEGVGCQPCWDQMRDIQRELPKFRAAGIDQIVTITGDPLDALRQKVSDEGLKSPVLADPGLTVSKTYSANQYGMMGTSTDGHSFILVEPNGAIGWRADYGGAPDYTMYVPVNNLLADLRAGQRRS